MTSPALREQPTRALEPALLLLLSSVSTHQFGRSDRMFLYDLEEVAPRDLLFKPIGLALSKGWVGSGF